MGGLETPPVADPSKTEKPPKKGISVHGKKIGRPTKESITAELEEKRRRAIESFGTALPGLLDMPFNAVAAKRGEHWKLDPKTRDALAGSLKGMMFDYLPLNLAKHMNALVFGTVLVAAVSSRYVEDVKLTRERKVKAAAEVKRRRDAGEPLGPVTGDSGQATA